METSRTTARGVVAGYCDARFTPVLEAFIDNFERRDEVGASVAIQIGGRTVVDLWGGRIAPDGAPWTRDTVTVVFSCTKGASALCAHMAADRGLLDLDAPVTRYWPEYGQAGKEETLVAMMLDHSAGVPHFREELKPGAYYDYWGMVALLEKEAAFWRPGERNGYHAVSSAWTVGEMVRRSTGRRLGEFFHEEVAGPLGLDFWIGLPESEERRVAPVLPFIPDENSRNSRIVKAAMADPGGPSALFLFNNGHFNPNAREARAAEIGSATGVGNARSLAGLYAPLASGGAVNGVRLVGADTLARMSRVSVATHLDATLAIPTRFSLGFMKSMDNRRLDNAADCSVVLPEEAFGHVGAGGSIGFADPRSQMSFGYVMNRMGAGILLNERGQSLVDAACRAVGYASDASGCWR
ncbi:serine hydrolase domain-containing protein [Camelimonas abortus]|uniref:Serine hydrolase domain-containing protein n=1 Tax=Camelimonas abortus TaxID=1017184 RepID=A0ABV7LFY9_9HYPH